MHFSRAPAPGKDLNMGVWQAYALLMRASYRDDLNTRVWGLRMRFSCEPATGKDLNTCVWGVSTHFSRAPATGQDLNICAWALLMRATTEINACTALHLAFHRSKLYHFPAQFALQLDPVIVHINTKKTSITTTQKPDSQIHKFCLKLTSIHICMQNTLFNIKSKHVMRIYDRTQKFNIVIKKKCEYIDKQIQNWEIDSTKLTQSHWLLREYFLCLYI